MNPQIEEAEWTDAEFSELLFMLVNEQKLDLKEVQAYWQTFPMRSGKVD